MPSSIQPASSVTNPTAQALWCGPLQVMIQPGGVASCTSAQAALVSTAIFTVVTPAAITPVPVITAITPVVGSHLSTFATTITGLNFTGATGVTFNGVAATAVVVVSDTSITCTSPTQAAAGVDSIVVTTPNGSSMASITTTS